MFVLYSKALVSMTTLRNDNKSSGVRGVWGMLKAAPPVGFLTYLQASRWFMKLVGKFWLVVQKKMIHEKCKYKSKEIDCWTFSSSSSAI